MRVGGGHVSLFGLVETQRSTPMSAGNGVLLSGASKMPAYSDVEDCKEGPVKTQSVPGGRPLGSSP